ncbi:MAG: NUDIX hydrolase [Saprospiraceae bacterium]|nr:NUDIX hydrolase [Saprospiraceae bacterium]
MEHPHNGTHLEALVLHGRPTVNVLCLTSQKELLLVEQYRFGSARFHLELPAGMVDVGESALEAAKRELLEETGYQGDNWLSLGTTYINPAYVDNTCEHFLVLDAAFVGRAAQDKTEDIFVQKIRVEEFDQLIIDGTICDGMSRSAWGMWRYLQSADLQ